MIGYSDLKELASAIGIPATALLVALSAFEFGILPSINSDTNSKVVGLHTKTDSAKLRMDDHDREVGHLIRQHTEQMQILNRALKEICLNTAKNEIRSYKCVELDGALSEKQ